MNAGIDCHVCSQMSIAVTRAKGDLVGVARRASRFTDPSPHMLALVASAKSAARRAVDDFSKHLNEHTDAA